MKKRFRNNQIKFYTTDEEKKFLEDEAKLSGMNVSEFLRNVIFKSQIIVKKVPVEEIKNAQTAMEKNAYEINKIGNNINQLVKVIHENNDTYSKRQIEDAVRDLENVIHEYENLCGIMFNKLYGLDRKEDDE